MISFRHFVSKVNYKQIINEVNIYAKTSQMYVFFSQNILTFETYCFWRPDNMYDVIIIHLNYTNLNLNKDMISCAIDNFVKRKVNYY